MYSAEAGQSALLLSNQECESGYQKVKLVEVKVGCGNGIAKVTDSNMHALVAIHRLNTMYMCVCVCVRVCTSYSAQVVHVC